MGNVKWNFPVLKNDKVYDYYFGSRELLRVEVYDGSPHLQIQEGKEFRTLGRIRKNLLKERRIY